MKIAAAYVHATYHQLIALPVYYRYCHDSKEVRTSGWQNEAQAVKCDQFEKELGKYDGECKDVDVSYSQYQVLNQLFPQVVVNSVQLVFLK
jgi:hypothetical protein